MGKLKASCVGSIVDESGRQVDDHLALELTRIHSVEDVLSSPGATELIDFIVNEATRQSQDVAPEEVEKTKEPTGWLASVPISLRGNIVASVNYLMMLVAIDFRHWGEDETYPPAQVGHVVHQKNFFAVVVDDERSSAQHTELGSNRGLVRGSAAMVYLLKRAVDVRGVHWYDPATVAKSSDEDLLDLFWGTEEDGVRRMLMPAAAERLSLLRSLSGALISRGQSFYSLVTGLECVPPDGRIRNLRLFDEGVERGILDRLVELHERYDDTSQLPVKSTTTTGNSSSGTATIHFLKLAQLSIVALQNAFPSVFEIVDIHLLGVCSDYQLPKALRACGLIVYSAQLSALVDGKILLGVNSREEIEIRVSSTIAAKRLEQWINANKLANSRRKCDAALMDYALWYFGRSNKSLNHHLCRTVMY